VGERDSRRKPELFRMIEPHLHDEEARRDLGRANYLAQEAHIESRFIYRHQAPGTLYHVWQGLHPQDTIIADKQKSEVQQIHPKRTYEETTPNGQLTHLLV
jgi:hypothetical protein